MRILTAAEMREVDRLTTERYGVPSLQLMETAGTRVAEFLEREFADLTRMRIAVLCGKGNNGGDGLVVARKLKERGCAPEVYLFAPLEAVRGDAAVNLKRWREMGEPRAVTSPAEWEAARKEVAAAQLIIDALLGTGLSGPVEGLLRAVVEDVNRFHDGASVVAVDMPSGAASDSSEIIGPAIRAAFTVTFTAPKLGQVFPPNSENVGRLLVRSIGSPYELVAADAATPLCWLEASEFRWLPRRRPARAHKGDYGHALVIAGSRGKTGAAVLAAGGCLRAGAGLVTVATPESVLPVVAAGMPEMMTYPLLSTEGGAIAAANLEYQRLSQLLRDRSVVALGPGLSTEQETRRFVQTVVAECSAPLVLDADGLNAFAGEAEKLSARKTTHLAVTPHPGEMARLVGCTAGEVQRRRLETARRAAKQWKAWVVLKGQHTIVAAPDGRAMVNSTGNPGMATGGTGDVLTGMLAGLTAQLGAENWERVLGLGVFLHGLAGDIAAREVGEAPLVATDLLRALPRAWQALIAGAADV